MKALQIFNFRGYVVVTLLTGLISVSAMAEVSHPAKLSQQALEGAAFDDPSTTITEVEGEKILDFTFLLNITIYSFRHSGAIEIFKRTGSLTKLQRAMGHSSLQVSLTYLRGLEVTELKEEDMPMV